MNDIFMTDKNVNAIFIIDKNVKKIFMTGENVNAIFVMGEMWMTFSWRVKMWMVFLRRRLEIYNFMFMNCGNWRGCSTNYNLWFDLLEIQFYSNWNSSFNGKESWESLSYCLKLMFRTCNKMSKNSTFLKFQKSRS